MKKVAHYNAQTLQSLFGKPGGIFKPLPEATAICASLQGATQTEIDIDANFSRL